MFPFISNLFVAYNPCSNSQEAIQYSDVCFNIGPGCVEAESQATASNTLAPTSFCFVQSPNTYHFNLGKDFMVQREEIVTV